MQAEVIDVSETSSMSATIDEKLLTAHDGSEKDVQKFKLKSLLAH